MFPAAIMRGDPGLALTSIKAFDLPQLSQVAGSLPALGGPFSAVVD